VTLKELYDAPDEPFIHPGRSPFGAFLFETGIALADCERRRVLAIQAAHAELDREDGGLEPLNADDFMETPDYDTNSEGDEQR
jgi:hypothetical protein